MAKTRDDIEKIIDTSVDLKKRRIYFGELLGDEKDGAFKWSTVELTIRLIHALSDNSQKPIELHMNSEGGAVSDMFRLYDAIHKCPCQIKFFGSGVIASSAAFIMAGCDERHLDRNTQIMLHKGSGGVSGEDNEADIQIAAAQNRRVGDMLCQILADNSKMSFDYWDQVMSRDVWLRPEEAIMLGLADKITEYKKRGNLRRSRIANMNKKIDEDALTATLININKRIDLKEDMKIEISIPKEHKDKDVYVDDTPVEEEIEISSQHSEEQQSQDPETDHS